MSLLANEIWRQNSSGRRALLASRLLSRLLAFIFEDDSLAVTDICSFLVKASRVQTTL